MAVAVPLDELLTFHNLFNSNQGINQMNAQTKLPLANRIAIINWKEFHAAKLNKKRRIRDTNGGCRRESFLSAEHYIILNLLRGLPADRGLSEDAFANASGNLRSAFAAQPQFIHYVLEKYAMPFGVSTYWLNGFLKANLK